MERDIVDAILSRLHRMGLFASDSLTNEEVHTLLADLANDVHEVMAEHALEER